MGGRLQPSPRRLDSARDRKCGPRFGRMSTFDRELEHRLRAAAFDYLDRLADVDAPLVRQADLVGFVFDGAARRLMATQQGIWKPKGLHAALSIRTVYAPDPARRPYDDVPGTDGYLRYKWRGT